MPGTVNPSLINSNSLSLRDILTRQASLTPSLLEELVGRSVSAALEALGSKFPNTLHSRYSAASQRTIKPTVKQPANEIIDSWSDTDFFLTHEVEPTEVSSVVVGWGNPMDISDDLAQPAAASPQHLLPSFIVNDIDFSTDSYKESPLTEEGSSDGDTFSPVSDLLPKGTGRSSSPTSPASSGAENSVGTANLEDSDLGSTPSLTPRSLISTYRRCRSSGSVRKPSAAVSRRSSKVASDPDCKKNNHRLIEKRYRQRVQIQMEKLHNLVQGGLETLASSAASGSGSEDGEDEYEGRSSKVAMLKGACLCIVKLRDANATLIAQNKRLKEQLRDAKAT